MNPCPSKSVTLLELLIAITLMGIIVLSFNGIELFSRYQVGIADRRTKVQNELSLILEHMSKNIARAIGNIVLDGSQNITNVYNPNPMVTILQAFVDGNQNGVRDINDSWIAYSYNSTNSYFDYCSQWNTTAGLCIQTTETLSNKITGLNIQAMPITQNHFRVNATSCWDPAATSYPCGAADNPSANMTTRILMPSVSTN